MEYTTLGGTGMKVSRICLGCLGFGSSSWRNWVLDEEASATVIERAIDLGINFFDTANMYSRGQSEVVLGNTLDCYDRDRLVVGTKVGWEMDSNNVNASGLSRKTVDQELQNSLDRLDMDTIDIYQVHRWDNETPIEVTLRALDDAIRRNKVRYAGASSMWTHQFQQALHTSDKHGLEQFVTMQNHYNLVYREEEREMLPLCEKETVGVLPWSPLARGYLARPHDDFLETMRGEYMKDSKFAKRIAAYRDNGGELINERIEELAADKDVTMAQIALAWLLYQKSVDAPVVGTTSVEHLEDAVEALEIDLTDSDLRYLEEPYRSGKVLGHS